MICLCIDLQWLSSFIGLEILGFGAIMDVKEDVEEYIETKITSAMPIQMQTPAKQGEFRIGLYVSMQAMWH